MGLFKGTTITSIIVSVYNSKAIRILTLIITLFIFSDLEGIKSIVFNIVFIMVKKNTYTEVDAKKYILTVNALINDLKLLF